MINDNLLSVTGGDLITYLNGSEGTATSVNQAWMDYLTREGYTTGTLNDRLYNKLRDDGFTGTLADMLTEFWSTPPVKPFTPLDLFNSGANGVWYDPSDLSTLFQDAAGTIPVTSDGDPVGLMLDKSQGLSTSGEKFNGFDKLGVWADNGDGSYTIDGSQTGGGSDLRGLTSYSPVDGTYVDIEIVVASIEGNSAPYAYTFHPAPTIYPLVEGVNKYRRIKSNALFLIRAPAGVSMTVKSVSIKEIKGNHATQSVSASRPTYRTDGTLHWLEFDGVDDYMRSSTAVTKPPSVAFAIKLTVARNPPASIVENSAFGARAGSSNVQYTTYGIKDYAVGIGYSVGVKAISLANVSDVNQNLTYRRNGVQQGAEVSGNGSIELGNTTDIGDRGTNGDIYGVVYRQGLFSVDDAQSLEKYLASKSGVTL